MCVREGDISPPWICLALMAAFLELNGVYIIHIIDITRTHSWRSRVLPQALGVQSRLVAEAADGSSAVSL